MVVGRLLKGGESKQSGSRCSLSRVVTDQDIIPSCIILDRKASLEVSIHLVLQAEPPSHLGQIAHDLVWVRGDDDC